MSAPSPSLALLVLGKSDVEIERFHAGSPHAGDEARLVIVCNPGKRLGGYAAIANPFIETATEDVVGIVHADTAFAAGALSALAQAAADRKVVGLVGRSPQRYVWGKDGGGEVSTLDSCAVFLPRRLGLRFDGVTFDDFHCLVEDLCLQALAIGVQSFVPPVKADHAGGIDRPASWMADYRRDRAKLAAKWSHVRFFTT